MVTNAFELAGQAVNRIGFGAMQLPGPGVMGPPKDHQAALQVLRYALDSGVNHIDTAQIYGPDVANQLIREALYPYPSDLAIVSKVGGRRDEKGAWLPAQRPEELRAGVEENLQTLGVECLAAVNLRLLDGPDGPEVDFSEQLGEMVALRSEGKIVGIGLSNGSCEQVDQAIVEAGITCVQNAYSLVSQEDNPVLDRCVEAGIAYVPFFPLGSAFPGMPKVADDEAAVEVAQRLSVTTAQVGLAWLLQRAANILLIPGTSSLTHLQENLAVSKIELSDEDLIRLDKR